MTPSVEHVTLEIGVMSLSFRLGPELALKKKGSSPNCKGMRTRGVTDEG